MPTDMKNMRQYGDAPFSLAVLHGGPAAPGSMAGVASDLAAAGIGVLEPFQTRESIDSLVAELKEILLARAEAPVTLVGHSWGAWLGFIFAARYSGLVKKLILVGSGPFEAGYAAGIMDARLGRLTETDRREARSLIASLNKPADSGLDGILSRFGALISTADAFDPLPLASTEIVCRYDLHVRIWAEASELRSSGKLLEMGRLIQCPVVAIHGDYDPHPSEGVAEPLARVLSDFRFYLLAKCGHEPWRERQAREKFYELLLRELL